MEPPDEPPEEPPEEPPDEPPEEPPELPPDEPPELPPDSPPELPPDEPPELPPDEPPELPPDEPPLIPGGVAQPASTMPRHAIAAQVRTADTIFRSLCGSRVMFFLPNRTLGTQTGRGVPTERQSFNHDTRAFRLAEQDKRQIVRFAGLFAIIARHPALSEPNEGLSTRRERAFAYMFDDFIEVNIVRQTIAGHENGVPGA